MQVHNTHHDALPLGERLTLVVITHNRNAFLRRTLQYYKGYGAKVLVLDSSTEGDASIAADYPAVDYRHLPQFTYKGLQDKLTYGVQQVTTPYMAFAADDDFLLYDGLTQSVDFLQANPDYGLCHGYGMMYVAQAREVNYYRRDRKVLEDYASESAAERVLAFMDNFLPPFYAVTRTDLLQQWYRQLPPEVSFEWQEIGHAFYLLACAKARILPIPFAVREANYGASEHNTNVLTVLTLKDAKSVAQRELFAQFLALLPTGLSDHTPQQARQIALDSFAAMAECLLSGRSLKGTMIVRSSWSEPGVAPTRRFAPEQFVEMPFYNQTMFDLLTEIEFLIHSMPAGRLQLQGLEGVLLRQQELMQVQANDNERTLRSRLWEALGCNLFNREVAKRLGESLKNSDEQDDYRLLKAWSERLQAMPAEHSSAQLANMPSGRLLDWLAARHPDAGQLKSIATYLAAHNGGPQFGILLLDLEADMVKLQATFDSLVNGHCRAFKLTIFTTGDLPASTTAQDTVHFVKVSAGNYVERINQLAEQSSADWLLLAEAGDQFTPSGLLRASLELLGVDGCRAVAMDEIQRQSGGGLVDVFRPGFNLDLLQSVPELMARHWLVRREVLLEAGGYSASCNQALEYDLLLRLIEQGGLAGMAHLAEPLLICQAPDEQENPQHAQVLTRHLASRGYKAQVSALRPGVYEVDYGHEERPLTSIILHSEDNFEPLQRCLVSILQRTRYSRYEVLIADNHSQSVELDTWLRSLEQKGERIRVLRSDRRLSASALLNAAASEARGDYLVFLSSDGEVVNADWIDSLLNQAQRPEVGVVGARLVDATGATTSAGLILGFEDHLGRAFAGEPKGAKGYLSALQVARSCSAVSGACLMVGKEVFAAVGGLDEEHFDQAFGDIDLCLKVADAGLLTVWTPQVQIQHPGALAENLQAAAALRDKWQARFQQDVAYNPNLTLSGKGFTLGAPVGVNWAQLLA